MIAAIMLKREEFLIETLVQSMRIRLASFKNNRIFGNVSWIMVDSVVQMLLGLFIGVMTARFLGPDQFGLLNYSLSIVTLFVAICKLGIDAIFMRDIINDPSITGVSMGSGIAMRVISAVISIILMLSVVTWTDPDNQLLFIVTLILSISLIFTAFELINIWFQSRLEYKIVSIVHIIAGLTMAVWKISLLVLEAKLIWFAISTTLEAALVTGLLLYLYIKKGGAKWNISISLSKGMLRQSYHMIFAGLLISLYSRMGQLMIGNQMTEADVGIYSVAIRLTDIWFMIPIAIINSVTPVIIEQRKSDYALYIVKLKQLYAAVLWGSIAVAVLYTFFSQFIVHLLYGEQYSQAEGIVNINVWAGMFTLVAIVRSIWVVSENYQKYEKYFILSGTLTCLILNFILIPVIGLHGAAWANVISQFVLAFLAPLLFKKTRIASLLMFDALRLKKVFPNTRSRGLQ